MEGRSWLHAHMVRRGGSWRRGGRDRPPVGDVLNLIIFPFRGAVSARPAHPHRRSGAAVPEVQRVVYFSISRVAKAALSHVRDWHPRRCRGGRAARHAGDDPRHWGTSPEGGERRGAERSCAHAYGAASIKRHPARELLELIPRRCEHREKDEPVPVMARCDGRPRVQQRVAEG